MTTTETARQTFPIGTRFATAAGIVTLEGIGTLPATVSYRNADGARAIFAVRTATGRVTYRWTIDQAAANLA